MRKLLVDMSHYPCLEFPQLNMGLTVEETRTAIEDGDNVWSAPFFNSFVSFPSEKLWGFNTDGELLNAFAKKYGFDGVEVVRGADGLRRDSSGANVRELRGEFLAMSEEARAEFLTRELEAMSEAKKRKEKKR